MWYFLIQYMTTGIDYAAQRRDDVQYHHVAPAPPARNESFGELMPQAE
jgi:hypothetical protein